MADARQLFDAVSHPRPIILTGLPLVKLGGAAKVRWAEEHSRNAHHHLHGARQIPAHERRRRAGRRPGEPPRQWEATGGTFIHHKDARSSLEQLAEIFPTVKLPA